MPTSSDPGWGFSWRAEWGLLRAAVQLLTRFPVVAPHGSDTIRRAARYLPLVGVGVGILAAGAFLLARVGLPPLLAALLSTGVTLLVTGALHEDGLADSCDGLFGGRDREAVLRIMRDSRIGSFGALGLVVVLGSKVACLAGLDDPASALIAAHAASRFFPVGIAAALPYARDAGMAAAIAAPRALELVVAGATAVAALLLLGPRAVPAIVLSAAAAAALTWYARERIGGYTGDILGAGQQVTEAMILLAALWHAG